MKIKILLWSIVMVILSNVVFGVTLDDNLLAYISNNDADVSGAVMEDIVDGLYNGTMSNLDSVPGKNYEARLSLGDGTNYMTLLGNIWPTGTYDDGNGVAFSLWFNITQSQAGCGVSPACYVGGHNVQPNYGAALYVKDTTYFQGNSAWGNGVNFSGAFDGEWHHLAMRANPEGGSRVYWYLDGVRVANLTKATAVGEQGNRKFQWFNYEEPNDYPLEGSLDEVAMWNDSISEAQVAELYNSGTGLFYDESTFIDILPPTASNWNITSNNSFIGENLSAWNHDGTSNITSNILVITFTLNEDGNCSTSTTPNNYTEMTNLCPNCKHETTNTTLQSVVLYDNLSHGDNRIYTSCIDTLGNEPLPGETTSGGKNVTMWGFPNISSLDYPTNGSNIFITTTTILIGFNFTTEIPWGGYDNCSLWINSTGWGLNTTITSVTNGSTQNISINLSVGSYLWNVECYSEKGLRNFSVNNYTLDITLNITSVGALWYDINGSQTYPNVKIEYCGNVTGFIFYPNHSTMSYTTVFSDENFNTTKTDTTYNYTCIDNPINVSYGNDSNWSTFVEFNNTIGSQYCEVNYTFINSTYRIDLNYKMLNTTNDDCIIQCYNYTASSFINLTANCDKNNQTLNIPYECHGGPQYKHRFRFGGNGSRLYEQSLNYTIFNHTNATWSFIFTDYNTSIVNQTDVCAINITSIHTTNTSNMSVSIYVNETFTDNPFYCGENDTVRRIINQSPWNIFNVLYSESKYINCWGDFINATDNKYHLITINATVI